MTKSEQYLAQIRRSEGLKRAIIQKIEIERGGKRIVFCLLTDLAFREEDERWAREVTSRFVPESFESDVRIQKLVAASDLVVRKAKELLNEYHPAASAFLREEDISAERREGGVQVTLGFSPSEKNVVGRDVLDSLSHKLEREFCGAFFVTVCEKQKEVIEIEEEEEEEEFRPACRTFEIAEFSPLDGIEEEPKWATYLADGISTEGDMTFCGVIQFIEERETQKGKPYFRFTVSDGTAIAKVMYFTKKATLDKIKALKTGDSIVCTGTNEAFHGSLSFHAKKINYGRVPAGFVPQKRACRPVPKSYRTVFPEEVLDYSQDDLFGKAPLPEDFLKKEFVVFDLETTGLNNNPVGGTMDRIIEIGAVRIRDGKIREKFSTFVSCPVRLSKEIVALTGISDDMLVGAPSIDDAIVDFYKFTDGAELVGHNVMFDYKFVSYYGERRDIRFDTRLYDTVTLAQEQLSLSNYKLNTVADYFKIAFQHHRAFDDALTTAKIFIELIRMKKCLPN